MFEKRYYAKGDEYDGWVYEEDELVAHTVGLEYAKDICNRLNERNELIIQGFEELGCAIDEKFDYEMKVKDTLRERYKHLQKCQEETEKSPRLWQGAIMELEVIADCLGVELK